MLSNIDITLASYQILVTPSPLKASRYAFTGFIASSACIHKIMENADGQSQLAG